MIRPESDFAAPNGAHGNGSHGNGADGHPGGGAGGSGGSGGGGGASGKASGKGAPRIPGDLLAPARMAVGQADENRRSAGRLGMTLFLAALGMLFAASMVGYLVVRLRAETWPPAGSPRLPAGLWVSTLILLASSGTMHLASRAARAGQSIRLRNFVTATLFLGAAFLASQLLNWAGLIAARLPAQANLYAFTFYMLTGLHAAHVLGGLIPLGITALHAAQNRYTPGSHEGVDYVAMYWHFLDVVWIVMFMVLVVAG